MIVDLQLFLFLEADFEHKISRYTSLIMQESLLFTFFKLKLNVRHLPRFG